MRELKIFNSRATKELKIFNSRATRGLNANQSMFILAPSVFTNYVNMFNKEFNWPVGLILGVLILQNFPKENKNSK